MAEPDQLRIEVGESCKQGFLISVQEQGYTV